MISLDTMEKAKPRSRISQEYLLRRKRAKLDAPLPGGNAVDNQQQNEQVKLDVVVVPKEGNPEIETVLAPASGTSQEAQCQPENPGDTGEKTETVSRARQGNEQEVDPVPEVEAVDSPHNQQQQNEVVAKEGNNETETVLASAPETSQETQCQPENPGDAGVETEAVSLAQQGNEQELDTLPEVDTVDPNDNQEQNEPVKMDVDVVAKDANPETETVLAPAPETSHETQCQLENSGDAGEETETVSPAPQGNEQELDTLPGVEEDAADSHNQQQNEPVDLDVKVVANKEANPETVLSPASGTSQETQCQPENSGDAGEETETVSPAQQSSEQELVLDHVPEVEVDAVDHNQQQNEPVKLDVEVVAKEDNPETVAPASGTPQGNEQKLDPLPEVEVDAVDSPHNQQQNEAMKLEVVAKEANPEEIEMALAPASGTSQEAQCQPENSGDAGEETERVSPAQQSSGQAMAVALDPLPLSIIEEDDEAAACSPRSPKESDLLDATELETVTTPITPPHQGKSSSTLQLQPEYSVAGTVSLEEVEQELASNGKLPKSPDFPEEDQERRVMHSLDTTEKVKPRRRINPEYLHQRKRAKVDAPLPEAVDNQQRNEPVKLDVEVVAKEGNPETGTVLAPASGTSQDTQCQPEKSGNVGEEKETVSPAQQSSEQALALDPVPMNIIEQEDEATPCSPKESDLVDAAEPVTVTTPPHQGKPSSTLQLQPENSVAGTVSLEDEVSSPEGPRRLNGTLLKSPDFSEEDQERRVMMSLETTEKAKPRRRISPEYLLQRKRANVDAPLPGEDAVDSSHTQQQNEPVKLDVEVVAKEANPDIETVLAPASGTSQDTQCQPENSGSGDAGEETETVSPAQQSSGNVLVLDPVPMSIIEEEDEAAAYSPRSPKKSDLVAAAELETVTTPRTPPHQGKPSSPLQLQPENSVAGTVSLEEVEREFDFMNCMFANKDEVSTPKGPRNGKLPKSPDFPDKNWIKPEVLLDEMFKKSWVLRSKNDDESACFKIPVDPAVIMTGSTWHIPELMVLKRKLNEVKSLLNYLPLNAWHKHTKQMNISNLIVSYVRYFNPEFSSQAWGKMFEILCTYNVIPGFVTDEINELIKDEKLAAAGEQIPLDSIHLCEAPGAFVSALNHFLQITFKGIDWNWLATTLSPYYEGNDIGKMINDDRLILESMNHWTFLEDSTGNLISTRNMNSLIEQQHKKLVMPRIVKGQKSHRVLLVTADGSIDCQNNPAEQEGTVAHLQYSEIIAALKILKRGGSFILKIFTFLESSTICHLYLLSCAFEEVHLFKPSTSKEGNSEVYVVCLGFLGDSTIASLIDNQLFPMLENYGDLLQAGKTLLPLNLIPPLFIDRIAKAAEFFCDYQMKIIRRNVSCFPCSNKTYQIMKPYRKEAAEQWIDWSEIRELHPNELLFTSADQSLINDSWHVDPREERGTFADKGARANGDDMQKLMYIKHDLATYRHWIGYDKYVLRVVNEVPRSKLGLKLEKPYDNIRCSRFCNGRILSDKEVVRDIAKKYLTALERQGVNSTMENVCNGHDRTRILDLMQKAGNPVDKDHLKILCFKKTSWDFLTKTDFQNEREDLSKVLATVKGLKENESLFLCRFPMLTRLQAGLIYRMAGLFEQATMYADLEGNVGIVFYKFQGLNQEKYKDFLNLTTGVFGLIVNDEGHWPVLEIAPMKTLIEFLPSEFLLSYNVSLLIQDTNRAILVTELAIGTGNA